MPINTIPERLNSFRVYIDGSSDVKGLTDIKLPSFESMKETVKGAGIAGEYESPTVGHFGSQKLTLNSRTLTLEFLNLLKQKAYKLDCRGALQEYDSAQGRQIIKKARVLVQGPAVKVDPGKFESGTAVGGSADIEVMYLKLELDGRTVVEYDKLNFIYIVDGQDQMAEIRAALGL